MREDPALAAGLNLYPEGGWSTPAWPRPTRNAA
jgi:hypothetical protein